MATVRVFGRESYDPNSKNRYYKNRDALGKVLNYMYRTMSLGQRTIGYQMAKETYLLKALA